MCGIAGLISLRPYAAEELHAIAERMSSTLTHRGPDGGGSWADAETGVALGHRRLSIIDLSAEGRQPMLSASGRYVISFNGEIYNFRDLRLDLTALGHTFRGHSDTEVFLAAAEQWGLVGAVTRCIGMFALAVWDRRARTIHLARDRLGEKPLYFGWAGNGFAFASELKALHAVPGFEARVDRDALCLYMRHGYVPAPHTIYQDIHKLQPGSVLSLTLAEAARGPQTDLPGRVARYWDAAAIAEAAAANPTPCDAEEALDGLDEALGAAVERCMVADVPIGAFLSGGIDSSLITALMQARSQRRVRTFSIGFHEKRFDEAPFAAAVARHRGTDHTELYVSEQDALDVVPKLPSMFDEPFADPSQIPTFLVSQLARQHVAVSLSGDGGDELFAGYGRYERVGGMAERLLAIPRPARRLMSGAIGAAGWVGVGNARLASLGRYLDADTFEELYLKAVTHWDRPARIVTGGRELSTAFSAPPASLGDRTRKMCFLDMVTYLPDDILVKVDRASMAVSLETRCPLLDHRVVEYALRVPTELTIRGGQSKWLLRQALYRHVPPELVERPKKGFSVPLAGWLDGPLRDWAEDLLDPRRLREDGFLEEKAVRSLWERRHYAPDVSASLLWDVLMFQAWLAARSGISATSRPDTTNASRIGAGVNRNRMVLSRAEGHSGCGRFVR